MKSCLIQISCILTAALMLAGCADSLQEVGTAGIDGIVSDKTTGEPVAVVNVVIEETGTSTVTGTDGTFSFKNLREGSLTLLIKKDGYKDGRFTVQTSKDRTTEAHLVIERMPAVMTLDKEVLDFGKNTSNNTMSFSMVNRNYESLDWEIIHNCSWIESIDPNKSVTPLEYGKTQTIVVTIDRNKIDESTNYETVIVVRTTGGAAELIVRVGDFVSDLDYVSIKSINLGVHPTDYSGGRIRWDDAKLFCESSRIGNCSDWRLPTWAEALQLYQFRNDIGNFQEPGQYSNYWTSDIQSNNGVPESAKVISFKDGSSYWTTNLSASTKWYVRCVRMLK